MEPSDVRAHFDALYAGADQLSRVQALMFPPEQRDPNLTTLGSTAFLTAAVLERLHRRVAEFANRTGLHIIDLGCGNGRLTRTCAPANAKLVVGLDFSRQALEVAQRGNTPTVVLQADMRALPFRDHAFNLVIANDSLHLIDDVAEVLAEAQRILVPGGSLIASLYERGTSNGASRREGWWIRELSNNGWRLSTWDDVTEEWRLVMRARHQWRWSNRWALLRELGSRAVTYCAVSQRMIGADGAVGFIDLNRRWETVAVRV